jgi:7-keto-8-aminopelargonate synthetase-like enzyme
MTGHAARRTTRSATLAMAFPTVPRGAARLRLMVSATHSREDLEFALHTLAETGRTCGIISGVAETS